MAGGPKSGQFKGTKAEEKMLHIKARGAIEANTLTETTMDSEDCCPQFASRPVSSNSL
jgi:hypothetical protein